jgi:hypothetical protein
MARILGVIAGSGRRVTEPPPVVSSFTVISDIATKEVGQTATAAWPAFNDPAVQSIQVEWKVGTGAYANRSTLAGTATSRKSPEFPGGSVVQARVRTIGITGLESEWIESTPVTLVPDAPTSISVSAATTVTISWAAPANNLFSTYTLQKSTEGAAFVDFLTNISDTTRTDTTVPASTSVRYRVRANGPGGSSVYRTSLSVTTNPAPPPPPPDDPAPGEPSGTLSSSLTTLTISLFPGSTTRLLGVQARLVDANTFTSSDAYDLKLTSGAAVSFSWIRSSGSYRVQAQTVDDRGVTSSSFFSNAVTVTSDTTPPSIPTPTLSWNNTQNEPRASWGTITDPSGVTSVKLQYRYSTTAAWTTQATYTNGDARSNQVVASQRNATVYVRLEATDGAGNTGVSSIASMATKPQGTFTVNSVSTSTHTSARGWRGDTDDVVSGRLDSFWETQRGFWFYGQNAITNVCKGYTPNTVRILMKRSGSSGLTGDNPISAHALGSRPAGEPAISGTTATGPSLTADQQVDYTIPSAWYAGFGNGTIQGVCTTTPTSTYRRLQGKSALSTSGRLTVIFD